MLAASATRERVPQVFRHHRRLNTFCACLCHGLAGPKCLTDCHLCLRFPVFSFNETAQVSFNQRLRMHLADPPSTPFHTGL